MEPHLRVHYVGSLYPGPTESEDNPTADAIKAEIDYFRDDPAVISHIPAGERGERNLYVQATVNHLAQTLGRNTIRVLHSAPNEQGPWREMDKRTRFRFFSGQHLQPGDLDYAKAALAEWEVFETVREEYRHQGKWHEGWKFQYSIPSPLSLAIVALGPESVEQEAFQQDKRKAKLAGAALWHTFKEVSYFREATAYEIEKVNRYIPPREAVAQIEATAEMLVTAKAYEVSPKVIGPQVARLMGRQVAHLVNMLPPMVDVDLHYCLGSLNNKAEGKMATLAPLVAIINATNGYLQRTPLHIHGPIAPADSPAPPMLERDYYEPLAELRLKEGSEFYAGFVNNRQSLEEHHDVVRTLRAHLQQGALAGVSTACGMGRYSRKDGQKLHTTLANLATL